MEIFDQLPNRTMHRTCLAFPGSIVMCVQGVSEELLLDINREATRRMTALVAPQASEAHGPPMLRLSMGQLFEEVCHFCQRNHPASSCLSWYATAVRRFELLGAVQLELC